MGLPKLQIGINLFAIGRMYLAPTKNSLHPSSFLLVDALNVGSSSSAIVISGLETDWFNINPAKSPWMCKSHELVGKTIDFEFTNTMFGAGLSDIKITLIDSNGDPEVILEKLNIKRWGLSLAGGRVRAKLHHERGPVLAECIK